jgi:hypothetical protein
MSSNLTDLTPPKLDHPERQAFFKHFYHRLAAHRNTAELYAHTEYILSSLPEEQKFQARYQFNQELNRWAQELLKNAWIACQEPGGGGSITISFYLTHVSEQQSS